MAGEQFREIWRRLTDLERIVYAEGEVICSESEEDVEGEEEAFGETEALSGSDSRGSETSEEVDEIPSEEFLSSYKRSNLYTGRLG